MSPYLPITLAGLAMAYLGAPFWLWFLLLEAIVIRLALVDMLESSPAPTTRRPSKPSHGPEELHGALEGQLGRPPSKSIHLGHPPASEPQRLEEPIEGLEELLKPPSRTPPEKIQGVLRVWATNFERDSKLEV